MTFLALLAPISVRGGDRGIGLGGTLESADATGI